ncbi:MAG: DUF2281 domain-containing protein, partial [Treponema sp.]|nr:DUF2281 domain-containing protein [Treponema sp.]
TNAEKLAEEIKTLPDEYVTEALDFVGYLKEKAARYEVNTCPLCEKYRNPVTGELRFNAETEAAMKEGDAMLRGEIPAKWYNSLEEMLVDLDSDD